MAAAKCISVFVGARTCQTLRQTPSGQSATSRPAGVLRQPPLTPQLQRFAPRRGLALGRPPVSDSAFKHVPEGGRRLNIFANQNLLGMLHEDKGLWALAHGPTWVERKGSFDLSPALPRSQLLHREGATSRPVQWYFDNLRPKETLRELIAGFARGGAELRLRAHTAGAPVQVAGVQPVGGPCQTSRWRPSSRPER